MCSWDGPVVCRGCSGGGEGSGLVVAALLKLWLVVVVVAFAFVPVVRFVLGAW